MNRVKLVPFKRNQNTSIKNYLTWASAHFGMGENLITYLENGLIFVNSNVVTDPDYLIISGDFIEISSDSIKEPRPPLPDILFQDENLFVVNKRAGEHSVDSIYGALWPVEDVIRWILTNEDNTNQFVAAIHRLDVDTSGVLVFALSHESVSAFGKAIQNRLTEKIYYALVSPPPQLREFSVDSPIGFDTSRPGFYISNGKNAKEARTRFFTEKIQNNKALLKCFPETGRTHQIRVHLKSIGSPVLGDNIYDGTPHPRLMLHCSQMHFYSIKDFNNKFICHPPTEFFEF